MGFDGRTNDDRKAKNMDQLNRPLTPSVSVAILTYVPFLRGFHRYGLDVLKLSLHSLFRNTDLPYELMIFDNGSCDEVVSFLRGLQEAGKIDFLFLSDKNIGKVGAWNVVFGAAQGEYIAYADSDVYYDPGWLGKHVEVFECFPRVGTVTGQPRRRRSTFSENSLRIAREIPDLDVQIGKYIPESWTMEHLRSLGKLEMLDEELERDDYLLTYQGVSAYITAQHHQFVVRREVVGKFLPFPFDRPMGADVARFDHAIDGSNLLRLAVADRVIHNLSNRPDEELLMSIELPEEEIPEITSSSRPPGKYAQRLLGLKLVERFLLAIHAAIFRMYYLSKIA